MHAKINKQKLTENDKTYIFCNIATSHQPTFYRCKTTFAKFTRNATHVKDTPKKQQKVMKHELEFRSKIDTKSDSNLCNPNNNPKYIFFQNKSQEGPQISIKSIKNASKDYICFCNRFQDTSWTILKPSCLIFAPFSSARGGLDLYLTGPFPPTHFLHRPSPNALQLQAP